MSTQKLVFGPANNVVVNLNEGAVKGWTIHISCEYEDLFLSIDAAKSLHTLLGHALQEYHQSVESDGVDVFLIPYFDED